MTERERLEEKIALLRVLGLTDGPNLGVIALANCELRAGVYMAALYRPGTDLSSRTHYTSEGEVQGEGYVAGGKQITGLALVHRGSIVGGLFRNAIWPNSTLTAGAAMIYDSSRDGIKVFSGDFETVSSVKDEFRCTWMGLQALSPSTQH
jgi:hypothetical protein